jgi:hypothetical protein
MKNYKFKIFGTLYEVTIKVTKRVPRYATVKFDTKWIYAGHTFKVDSVYMESNRFAPERGRSLRLSLSGTKWGKSEQNPKGYTSTVIDEIDLILKY